MIKIMEITLIITGLILAGLIVGSFNGATVWRLRARQLKEDKKFGEKVDKKEYDQLKNLLGKSVSNDRSMCLHCHHKLEWYDLIPLFSWVQLRGKCRYCHKPIGYMEPLIELGTAGFFLLSYLFWITPLETVFDWTNLVLWLVVGCGLIILLAYDTRWFLLPNRVTYPLFILSGIVALLRIATSSDAVSSLIDVILAVSILSGFYYVLYVVSKRQWIGFGDIKLGLVLALMLGNWQLAFLTLFLANLIGSFIVLPGLLAKKLERTSHIPFGPMLIVAYFISALFGEAIILWYFGIFAI